MRRSKGEAGPGGHRTTHLVTGVAGQDGVLLARHLRRAGARVVGTVRNLGDFERVACYLDGIDVLEHDVCDQSGFQALLEEHQPVAVHNLAALSSVGASWGAADATRAVNELAVIGMLETLGRLGSDAPAFVQASSSEIFGPVASGSTVDESTPLQPVSPYAEAKASAHLAVARARAQGMHATNLVMFGHTSSLQAPSFVLPRITRAIAEVALGRRAVIELQDPAVRRDWGAASDYVRAFPLALDAPAGDFVLGTGKTHALAEVVSWGLEAIGAPATPLVAAAEPARPHDFDGAGADPGRAETVLGWQAETPLRQVVERMVATDLARLRTGREHDPSYLEGESA